MEKPSVIVCHEQTCVKVRGKYAYWIIFAVVALIAIFAYRVATAKNVNIRIG